MYKENKCLKCGTCLKKCEHKECKPFGKCIHACPENCLSISGKTVKAKELASDLHKKYTGVTNEKILKNFEILRVSGKPYIIRTPLIPNITDTSENLQGIKEIIGDSKWEQLPFNVAAGAKYKMLGMEYKLVEDY